MKAPLLLAFILCCAVSSGAQYWNSELKLPRLKGVKKILVKETRWDYSANKKQPTVRKSVLYLNPEGLVVQEDEYDVHSWVDTRNTYEYVGNDTEITYIRVFTYLGGMLTLHPKPPPKDARLSQVIEFVNEHTNPLHREWRFYQLPDSATKRLLNITSTDYDAAGHSLYGHYYSYESSPYVDSIAYRYSGDTLFSVKYRKGAESNSGEKWDAIEQEVSLQRKDSAGRIVYAERISSTWSHMGRKSHFLYDRAGRYLGEHYLQDCDACSQGWQSGGSRRMYDSKSRLRSVVHFHQGRDEMRYDLVYVE